MHTLKGDEFDAREAAVYHLIGIIMGIAALKITTPYIVKNHPSSCNINFSYMQVSLLINQWKVDVDVQQFFFKWLL